MSGEFSNEKAQDFLVKYISGNSFDAKKLIDDDFGKAIKLLYENKLYVSCIKLLFIFLDTMAYTESGDSYGGAGFRSWLESYMNLTLLKCSAEELWQCRNSLLHTTTGASHKVTDGKVRKVTFYMGDLPPKAEELDVGSILVNLKVFLNESSKAATKYLNVVFMHKLDRIDQFVERYDLILSDTRISKIEFN